MNPAAPGQPSTHLQAFRQFLKLESTGGVILFGAAVAAMLVKNSPLADWYTGLLTLPVQIRIGDLDLNKPLVLGVNDGVMAVFFLLVSLEIKREILVGIALGLRVGKPVGVLAFSWLAIRLKWASLHAAVDWKQLTGAALMCGIGFTMSLFIGSLAFQEVGIGYNRADRIGIICGSLISGIAGYLVLRHALPSPKSAAYRGLTGTELDG